MKKALILCALAAFAACAAPQLVPSHVGEAKQAISASSPCPAPTDTTPVPDPTTTPTTTPPSGPVFASLSPTNGESKTMPIDFSASNNALAGAKPAPSCAPSAGGRRLDVTDQASMDAVPWTSLAPGDVVCVAYSPTPYRAKIYFVTRGAPGAPISLVGLRGPNGERPIIDGDGAKTSPLIQPSTDDANKMQSAVISLLTHFVAPPNAPWGWHPGWITIAGLKVQHARPQYSFTDGKGAKLSYDAFSAAIYVLASDHVRIEDCEIADSQLGVFANSLELTPGQGDRTAVDFTLRGNYIHGNGDPAYLGIHEIYIEGRGCNIIGNWIESTTSNAGVLLKSRCGHERIQANTFVGGVPNQALVQLIDPQSGWDSLGLAADFQPSVLAGNLLVDARGAMGPLVYFGGDSYTYPDHYKTRLIAYGNTLVGAGPLGGRAPVFAQGYLTPTDPGMVTYAINNAISNLSPAGILSLATGQGQLLLSGNWVDATVLAHDQYDNSIGLVVTTSPVPGATPNFSAPATGDYRPATGSALIDTGVSTTVLPPIADMGVFEPTGTAQNPWYRVRPINRTIDVGAFEAP